MYSSPASALTSQIGVRTEGAYRFKFSAYELVSGTAYLRAIVFSDVFHVYSAKRFPGMLASTPLSKAFAEQGLRIRVRKPAKCARRS